MDEAAKMFVRELETHNTLVQVWSQTDEVWLWGGVSKRMSVGPFGACPPAPPALILPRAPRQAPCPLRDTCSKSSP